jgi:TolA-binding protein
MATAAEKQQLAAQAKEITELRQQLDKATTTAVQVSTEAQAKIENLQKELADTREELADAKRLIELEAITTAQLRISLTQAEQDVLDLNQELSKAAQPAAQQQELLRTDDGQAYRLNVPAFNYKGQAYKREDVASGSALLEELAQVGAGILEKVAE